MNDAEKREKVVEGLKELQSHYQAMAGISSSKQGRASHIESARTIGEAIALLKAQEPREPTLDIRHGKSMWRCGSCSTALQPNQINAKFCFNCGRAVKWE